MKFLVVPNADGSVSVIETALKVSEPVRISKRPRVRGPVEVPKELTVSWLKIGAVSRAA